MISLLIAMVLLFAVSSFAFGYGVFGETDLMFPPTATTLGQNNLGISVHMMQGNLSYFNFDYGLVPDLEMGVALFNYPNDTFISFRGKFRLLREDRSTPGLAIGVEDLGRNSVSPYLTLSKSITDLGLKGYLGVGGGSFDGLFGGISKTFYGGQSSVIKQVELAVEADSHNLNIGTKLGIGSQTKVNFGLVDMQNWIVGVSFLVK